MVETDSHTPPDTYTVRTDTFEGPLDLLLSLIEKRKLHISDIALAEVCDEFIAYIESQEAFPLSSASHFIYIASTLLLIKSKSLLPTLELTEEETSDIAELEERLRLYTLIKPFTKRIREQYGRAPLYGSRPGKKEPMFAPDAFTEPGALHAAIHDVIQHLPHFRPENTTVVAHVISVEEMINSLTTRVQREVSVSFQSLTTSSDADRTTVVTSFLALLELIKRGAVAVKQAEHFGDITVEAQDMETPHYGE